MFNRLKSFFRVRTPPKVVQARFDAAQTTRDNHCHPHGPEFRWEMNSVRPMHEGRFNLIVEILAAGEHLKARSRPDGVVGEHLNQPFGVTVVRNLVTGSLPQSAPDFRRRLHDRQAQQAGRGPCYQGSKPAISWIQATCVLV